MIRKLTMSTIRHSARLARHPRRLPLARRYLHQRAFITSGLWPSQPSATLRHHRRLRWPFGASYLHNVPAVRNASFARVLPKLALKLVRIPAMLGAAAVGGVTYLQYQATRELPYSEGHLRCEG